MDQRPCNFELLGKKKNMQKTLSDVRIGNGFLTGTILHQNIIARINK